MTTVAIAIASMEIAVINNTSSSIDSDVISGDRKTPKSTLSSFPAPNVNASNFSEYMYRALLKCS